MSRFSASAPACHALGLGLACLGLACLALAGPGPAAAASLTVAVADEHGRPLPEAVVFLDSPEAARAVRPMAGAEIGQKDKTFIPSVLVVTRGTPVAFPNRDTVRHHVYSFSPAKTFEIKLYIGTPASPVTFEQPGIVVLGCNIHDHMMAHVVVLDTPWHARSDAQGAASLRDVPVGAYRLRAWHPRLPAHEALAELPVRLGADAASVRIVLRGLGAH